MSDSPKFPLGRIYRGEVVKASYGDPGVACYRGNPLIEALPPILTVKQVINSLTYYPEYDESERLVDSQHRLHLIDNALDLFIPLPIHVDLEQRLSRVIRGGYKDRHPERAQFWKERKQKLQSSHDFVPHNRNRASKRTRGFTIIGTSGGGKSTSIEKVLSLYPQGILHTHYNEEDFIFAQLVWMQLQCPYDGNPRSICMNFFRAVDDLFGTTYERTFGRNRPNLTQLILDMKGVASGHCLGVLVIDDIEHLSTAKSGGAEELLNFFVQLTNTLGVPVMLVGTFKAMKILTREFRQIRRGTGQGDMVWDRILKDWTDDENERPGDWQRFLNKLWKYQYVRKPCKLTRELSGALYYESQGVTDFVVKVFMLAQIRAITTGLEEINVDIIQSVAHDCLRLAQPVLRILRRILEGVSTIEELSEVDDIHRIDLEPFFKQARLEMRKQRKTELASENVEESQPEDVAEETSAASEAESGVESNVGVEPPTQKTQAHRSSRRRPTKSDFADDDLRRVLLAAKESGKCLYEALRREGYIGSTAGYLQGGVSS